MQDMFLKASTSYIYIYITVTKMQVWIGSWIYWVLRDHNYSYYNIAARNVQSLHANLFSLSELVFMGL